jgi:cytidylate kinase
MPEKSLEERVAAIEVELAGKTLQEHFREHGDLIDRLLVYRLDEQDKKWDAKLDAKFARFEEKQDANLDAKFATFEQRLDAKLDVKLETKLEAKLEAKLETKLEAKLAPIRNAIQILLTRG